MNTPNTPYTIRMTGINGDVNEVLVDSRQEAALMTLAIMTRLLATIPGSRVLNKQVDPANPAMWLEVGADGKVARVDAFPTDQPPK